MDEEIEMLDQEQEAARQQAEMEERLQMLGASLQRKADECVSRKVDVETRWLEDLRQYNGLYDPQVLSRIQANKGSELFLNITRPMANMLEARLGDMLFPTDDKNWGIEPTPVPELSNAATQVAPAAPMQPGQPPQMTPTPQAMQANQILEEARKRCTAMELEIDDQLWEAKYNAVARDVIHDSLVLGTGIVKGPVVMGRTKKRWDQIQDEFGQTAQVLTIEEDQSPTVQRVDPWSFFPDHNALRLEDSEYIFERHLLTRTQLRSLAKQPGFLTEQIKQVLAEDRDSTSPNYIAEIRDISGVATGSVSGKYQVWEYHGPIDKDDLRAAGVEVSDNELEEYSGIVWICNDRVIKATMNPLETGEHPYSVYQWEKDDTSIWGIGVPRLTRNSQRTVNAAARMAMDNGGLAVGPQVIADERIVRPADGNWALGPRKIWLKTDPTVPAQAAFAVFQVDSRLNELLAVIEKAQEWARNEANLPMHMAADQATPMNETYRGTALLMNSANVVMRRAVKWWDDDITRPLIGRFYDWNMQFNPKENIKGDYLVMARGSSALLVKELQQQALMALGQYVLSPALAPMSKVPDWYREVFRSMQLDPDQFVKTDEEIQQEQQAAAGQEPQMPPELQLKQAEMQMRAQIEQAKLQAEQQRWQAEHQLKISQMQQPNPVDMAKVQAMQAKIQRDSQNDEWDHYAAMAQIQKDLARMAADREMSQAQMQMELAKMAHERDMSIEKLKSMLGMEQMKLSNQTERFNAEVALKARMGQGI